MAFYDEDLAWVHHVGFGDYARDAAPGLIDLLWRAGVDGGLVVDLGCGSGILARALADAGYAVLGIDQSAAMLRLARRQAPEASFRRASFVDAELPRCAAVTSIGECLGYLFDERNGWATLERVARRVHRALAPGGLFLFDLAVPGRGDAPQPIVRSGDDWLLVSRAHEDRRRRILTREITTFRQVGRHYRRSDETHRLRLFESRSVAARLRRIGFTVRQRRRWGAKPLPPGVVAFVARRP